MNLKRLGRKGLFLLLADVRLGVTVVMTSDEVQQQDHELVAAS